MSTPQAPAVSVGVPVYNGERHLRAALDSLLAQSHTDLELVVSDNASTDATWEICSEYARRDARVRTFRQKTNGGVAANWNFVALQARGRYFKWASASDVCASAMLERCLQVMDDRGVALAFGRTCFIDDEGREVGVFDKDLVVADDRPGDRFARVCQRLSINNGLNGLIRREALLRTRLHRAYPHSDRVLMAELAMHGRFVLLPEVLLFRRSGPEHFTALRSQRELEQMFKPQARQPLKLVHLRRHADFVLGALRSPVPLAERLRAANAALRGLYWDRAGLREDLSGLMSRRHA